MIRHLNNKDQADQRLLSSLARLSLTEEWKEFQSFLEVELRKMDIMNRTAEPYMSTRLGAGAETLQDVLDRVIKAVETIRQG